MRFKPESIERSIDLDKRGYTSGSRRSFKFPPTNEFDVYIFLLDDWN
jgi:hypothetical protein